MGRILYIFLFVATLMSCAETYKVKGSTSVSLMDGSQLYLKTIEDNEFKTLDSCSVLHGKFEFSGTIDTVFMASIFVGEDNLMPIVLEAGEITVSVSGTDQVVTGTELNDTLYSFLHRHARLENSMNELSHRLSQMILDGVDEEEARRVLTADAQMIAAAEDVLVTEFISENYDNVLGPGVFMMLTSGFQYPILTPQIEHIMANATDKFKNNPYVSDYLRAAHANEAQLSGVDPATAANAPVQEVPAADSTAVDAAAE